MARQDRGEGPAKAKQQRSPLNMKASPELRARIEKAAERNGLSLTQEVERRLLQSFDTEDQLGGPDGLAFFRASASAFKLIEARTGAKWTEDAATWRAAKEMLNRQLSNWRPIPPNAAEIVRTQEAAKTANAEFIKVLDAYRHEYPVQVSAFEPISSRNALMARLDRDYRIPTEARDDHERREMEAGWALVEAAGQRVREALEAAEKAFAEHDRAEQEGEKLAKDLLSAINIVTARQDGQA